MLCYFISDNSSIYYESKIFKNIMQQVSKLQNCEIKERKKLYIIFDNIESIDDSIINLDRFKLIDN